MHDPDPTGPCPLYEDETVSDLLQQGLRLIQPRHGFRFGEDTVLLADYAARSFIGQSRRMLRVADLGAGSGAASLLLAARLPAAAILSVEIEAHSQSALRRNIQLNGLADRITPLCADYSRWTRGKTLLLPSGSPPAGCFDLVVANPPYGLPSALTDLKWAHARKESLMSLEALVEAACCLLRPHGRLVLVHRSQRLTDVLTACRKGGVEPKSLRFIASLPDRPPARFLLTGVRDARPGALTVAAPLVIRNNGHELSDEVQQIYNNDAPMAAGPLMSGLVRIGQAWPERGQDRYEQAF